MACMRDNVMEHATLNNGRYETIKPLNHGSFGMVFMATDHSTGDYVAIKCLTKKSAAAETSFAVDDKSEELELHRRLGRHPNIVGIIDSFETAAHVFLVIEFCSRGDLYEAICKEQGPLETERVRAFMLELVDAVEHMHSRGIYHRDIKPENIFLTRDGTPKLGDFGLATTDKWSMEMAVGSDRYMAPEQFDSAGAGYSPAEADIWALGICLMNILFQRNPFESPTEADRIFLDFSRDKQSLFDVFPTMSQDTFNVLMACLSPDPRKRSLAALREALERAVSFTTIDEAFDEFCAVDATQVGASCNREPLRTPSLQTTQAAADGAFPWTRAIRTLDTIPDNDEDLASPKLEEGTADWFSGAGNTPSTASVLESAMGESLPRGGVGARAMPAPRDIPQARVSPMAGSLPINVSRPRAVPSWAAVFPAKQQVSKSWSDMWEEDEEEEEVQVVREDYDDESSSDEAVLDDSADELDMELEGQDDTVVMPPSSAAASPLRDVLDGPVEGGFFMHDTAAATPVGHKSPAARPTASVSLAKISPADVVAPSFNKGGSKNSLDKWVKLGEQRRRAAEKPPTAASLSPDAKLRRTFGGFSLGAVAGAAGSVISGGGCGGWDSHHNVLGGHGFFSSGVVANHAHHPTKERTRDGRVSFTSNTKAARDPNWRRAAKPVGGDEWVGGW